MRANDHFAPCIILLANKTFKSPPQSNRPYIVVRLIFKGNRNCPHKKEATCEPCDANENHDNLVARWIAREGKGCKKRKCSGTKISVLQQMWNRRHGNWPPHQQSIWKAVHYGQGFKPKARDTTVGQKTWLHPTLLLTLITRWKGVRTVRVVWCCRTKSKPRMIAAILVTIEK